MNDEDDSEFKMIELNTSSFSSGNSGVKTYFVFLDFYQHFEILAGYLPILNDGTAVEFNVQFRSPKNPSRTKEVSGIYFVKRRILTWKNDPIRGNGLIQFLEWEKLKEG